MYAPTIDHADDEKARAFIAAHPFALLVTATDAGPRATHLPVLSVVNSAGKLELHTHMARANSQWRDFSGAHAERPVLVVFSGPHAYISPSHYERPDAVPTWNYVAVHTTGRARLVTDRDLALAQQLALVEHFDPPAAARMPEMAPHELEALLGAIVAFVIEVDTLEARFKLSNNKTAHERDTIVAALEASGDGAAIATAAMMKTRY